MGLVVLAPRLKSSRAWAELLLGMWDPPGSEIESVYPALAGRFFTTEPPGKPGQCPFELYKKHELWS